MRYLNKQTGEINEVTSHEIRLGRMRKRLSIFANWKEEVDDYISEVDVIRVTLTYRGVDDWRPKHITEFIRKVRRYLGKSMYGYFWVSEMQKRGAVHYHVAFVVKKGMRFPKPDDEGYWTYGMTRIEKIRHIYSYFAKYMQKEEQKEGYPKGIRVFGSSIYVHKEGIKMMQKPQWLQQAILKLVIETEDTSQRVKLLSLAGFRKVKGGYQCAGCFIVNPYSFSLR